MRDEADLSWDDKSSNAQGASLTAFQKILQTTGYVMVQVQGAALFAVPEEDIASLPFAERSLHELWGDYLNGPKEWIGTDRDIVDASKEELLGILQKKLNDHEGSYDLRVE